MNNLLSGSAIVRGQKLNVYRKQRSHSLPVLPFADKMDAQELSNNNDNVVDDDRDQQQPEASPRSSDQFKGFLPPRKTASFHPEDDANSSSDAAKAKRKQRSKSERLHVHFEEELVLPRLIGGTAMEVLSDERYCSKLVPKLETSLSMRFRGYDWQLLYSLAQHGSSLHTLLRNAHGASPTLVVVETTRGDVFGGFAAVPWKQSKSYYGNGEAFVFTCQPRFERFPWSRKNAMYMLSTDQSIGMGGGYATLASVVVWACCCAVLLTLVVWMCCCFAAVAALRGL